MVHSAGIIPFRQRIDEGGLEFFVGHPGGMRRNYWAFLKGRIEEGESTMDAAIREFSEESGVSESAIREKTLIPLGSVMQTSHKMVTAFGAEFRDINATDCRSNRVEGSEIPEIDAYRWMTYDELKHVTCPAHLLFYSTLEKMKKSMEG